MLKPKISIITVSYNAVRTIEETIKSVVTQNYPDLEYIVIDGGSTDDTVDIIKKYERRISYWVSEPDQGMYDALAKGFQYVTGDICAYINADDYYQPYTFDVVSEVFQNIDVKWITGIQTTYNAKSQITAVKIPYKYRKRFIQNGLYDGRFLSFIQQESTFWHTDLLQHVDMDIFRSFKLAGDYYLWSVFCQEANLDIVQSVLSGFRIGRNQLSSDMKSYREELRSFTSGHIGIRDVIRIFCDRLCGGFPGRLNQDIIQYNYVKEKWERKRGADKEII